MYVCMYVCGIWYVKVELLKERRKEGKKMEDDKVEEDVSTLAVALVGVERYVGNSLVTHRPRAGPSKATRPRTRPRTGPLRTKTPEPP